MASSVMEVQQQIRANASNLQDYFSDLYAWEKKIEKQHETRQRGDGKKCINAAAPLPRARTSVETTSSRSAPTMKTNDGHPAKPVAAHTYDKGYKRWASFDVDAALKECDDESNPATTTSSITNENSSSNSNTQRTNVRNPVAAPVTASKPAASLTTKQREDLEREQGNAHYKRGDYVAAIKSYTRCLGFNARNAVVLSNRAMAYLKNREFTKAEDDCSLALSIDPKHVKSYSRRGTARNSLGKHRLALLDFERAAELEPSSKQIQSQVTATREQMRTAIKRSPKRTNFLIEVIGESTLETAPTAKPTRVKTRNSAQSETISNISSHPLQAYDEKALVAESRATPAVESVKESTDSSETPARVATPRKTTSSTLSLMPKCPTKAPATAYEFTRVWNTLALKGDGVRREQLLNLRAEYLLLLNPSSLRVIFKNSIEADTVREIFYVFRHANTFTGSPESRRFVLQFAQELTNVPRFSMTVMFLSDKEKEDILSVLQGLQAEFASDEAHANTLRKLFRTYEL